MIKAEDDLIVLLIRVHLLKGSIVSYGPLVMNAQAGISEAIVDFDTGKYGHLAQWQKQNLSLKKTMFSGIVVLIF